MMKKPQKPDESELLAYLDAELTPQRQAEIRQQLAADWELRANLAKLERRVEQFVDATACDQVPDDQLPLDDWWRDFSARLTATPQQSAWQARWRLVFTWRLFFTKLSATLRPEFRWRLLVGATACLGGVMALAWFIWQAERPVSAQEFLQRTTQAEAANLRRVREPVIYRKIQIKRGDTAESVLWESWNDTTRQQYRQRVADQQGVRFLRANEASNVAGRPALLTELESVFAANHLDPQHPLSAAAFAAWRAQVRPQSETVTRTPDGLKLTTRMAAPHALNGIIEASLIVRDWHAVALQFNVQGANEIRRYELSESAYEILPLQALTVFADLPPAATFSPTPRPTVSVAPTRIAAAPSPTIPLPSVAALQESEIAALYALHQLKADLGEQIEVGREGNKQIVVRGLVQSASRKEELLRALSRIAFVSPQILTIEEAVQQAQRAAPTANETVIATNETIVSDSQPAAAVNPFQQKLTEQFGGRKGMSDMERAEVNQQVTQFYNAIEADASAALAEAWALRRLQERFATKTVAEIEEATRLRLAEMQGNHLARLRQRARNLQTRLRPLLIAFAGDVAALSFTTEPTRLAQLLTVFRSIEQTHRLTDQLIEGNTTTAPPQLARALLTELMRLDAVLAALEKN